jgi:hypothetical protein
MDVGSCIYRVVTTAVLITLRYLEYWAKDFFFLFTNYFYTMVAFN